MNKIKIGALASGSGSNFLSIVQSCKNGILKKKASVEILICNKAGAYCMERAKSHEIPHVLIESDNHQGTREEFDQKLIEVLDRYGCNLIVLVGYMRFVCEFFINHFNGKIMNIHPALLPSFKGMHAHEDAIAYGVKVSGVTVHFVDIHEDNGGPRILKWEHKVFPKAIELFCDGRLHIEGRIVKIDGEVKL